MKSLKIALVFLVFILTQSCTTTKVIDVKSPCVSGEDGPCGPKIPVNTWLEKYKS